MLAKHKKGLAKTAHEIARDGSIPYREVETLSRSITWEGTPINIVKGYLIGCELDFCNPVQMRRLHEYLRRPQWVHLKKSPHYDPYFIGIIKIYQDYLKQKHGIKKG